MARVMILGAISIAILFMAVTVSSSRITVTIAEEAENPQSQRCQQQIQQAQQLRSCQQYMRQKAQSSFEEEDQTSPDVQPCCQQLQQIQDAQCRCEGLRQVVQKEQQHGELQGRERQQMMRTAEYLPGLCRLSPQRCEMHTHSLF